MMLSANLIKFRSGSEIPNKRQGIAPSLKGFWIFLCLACAIPIFIGCRAINKPKIRNATPLAALEKAPSQTELEVVFVRIPPRDQEATNLLWQEVDELAIDAKFRRELHKNGFRVGVVGPNSSGEIQEILQSAHHARTGNVALEDVGDMQSTHAISRKVFLQRGQQSELLASSIQKEFQMLEMHDGKLVGQTLNDGQAQFIVKIQELKNAQVTLRLIPEIHFGPFHNEYIPGDGMFQLQTSREKKRLTRLQVDADLQPGQILIVGPQADQPGSLGHRFFNEQSADKSISKIMMIRLCDFPITELESADDNDASD